MASAKKVSVKSKTTMDLKKGKVSTKVVKQEKPSAKGKAPVKKHATRATPKKAEPVKKRDAKAASKKPVAGGKKPVPAGKKVATGGKKVAVGGKRQKL